MNDRKHEEWQSGPRKSRYRGLVQSAAAEVRHNVKNETPTVNIQARLLESSPENESA